MRPLSKSKLLAFRQCPKRLWLEVHQPELRADSGPALASFATGHQVGDIARQLYDPQGQGTLIDPQAEGFDAAFARTQHLLANSRQPIFEAGFRAGGGLAFADVLLPTADGAHSGWRMVEVKSSTSVKDYHRDDAAIQAYLARESGLALTAIALAHIDSGWIYPGHGDYRGLLCENDLSEETFARADEVKDWIAEAQAVAQCDSAPVVATGAQCFHPFECGFYSHCASFEPQAEHPIYWLPRPGQAVKIHVQTHGVTELRDLPDDLLNPLQLRVKQATLSGEVFFDQASAAQALAGYSLPAYFIDFETIQFAVPIWAGTRPYQQIPFQFSVHHLDASGHATHTAFLDLSGHNPCRAFAQGLLAACGTQGPVFVYNAAFETTRIRELAERFADLAQHLLALNERVVDLLPIARQHYYHPSQQGSWSIKAVLPALCPDLRYTDLHGVQDGGMAQQAYLEAIAPSTTAPRKAELECQLLAYCQLDTWAMVRLWAAFTANTLKDH